MKEAMKTNYRSKDLMLSAAILAEGVALIDAQDEGGYLSFYFDDLKECERIERDWWAGRLTVNAQRYAEAIKRLKGLVHSRSYTRRGG